MLCFVPVPSTCCGVSWSVVYVDAYVLQWFGGEGLRKEDGPRGEGDVAEDGDRSFPGE